MKRIILTASEGMMLTNGEIYAKEIALGDWDKAENYREIPIEEYEAMIGGESSDV